MVEKEPQPKNTADRREVNLSDTMTIHGFPKKKIYYVSCPMCARTLPINTEHLFDLDLDTAELIQIRQGGGRALGFSIIGREKTLMELNKDLQYCNLVIKIKKQCYEILRIIGEK